MNCRLYPPAWLVCLAALLAAAGSANAQQIKNLERLEPGQVVRDPAKLFDQAAREQAEKICRELQTRTGTRAVVLGINNMQLYGGEGLRMETFARLVYDHWELGGTPSPGVLLLISREDQRCWLEFGPGWNLERDHGRHKILNRLVAPACASGRFSDALVTGATGIDKLMRGESIPSAPVAWGAVSWVAVIVGLAVFTVASLVRSGPTGWGYLLWSTVFGATAALLYYLASRSSPARRGRRAATQDKRSAAT